jgi:isoleucyl-tRNA synthetase
MTKPTRTRRSASDHRARSDHAHVAIPVSMSYRTLPESPIELEEAILATWETEDTFHRGLRLRRASPEFVFYEGPPTANGKPGVHHILARTIKDTVARYRAMTGWHVTRLAGWDTHGLPVEIEAEKQLGISGKPEIERLGIARFNQVCRENLFTYKEDWERLSRRIGYWLDYENAYVTCTPEYIESVWWALAEIHRKGLLYKGYKVLPYCPRCGTGLSSHEVAQGYRLVSEPSVYVKFRLEDDPAGASILSWTTTPWTLPGNVALAVGEEIDYLRVRIGEPREDESFPGGASPGEELIVASPLAEDVLRHPYDVVEVLSGADLVGRRYRPLFPGAVDADGHPAVWTVLAAEFVTTDEGTGVVHTAVMYGEDDFELGAREGLPMQHTVDPDGRFVDRVPEGLAGRLVKDPDTDDAIIGSLADRDLLYRRQMYEHSYPHCWRCDSALLYMARDSWYIRTTAVRDRLLENNASVDWQPPEIGSGRMGEWLAGNVDWAISRDRYWGTPLPIWTCDSDPAHFQVIGSLAELAGLAGGLPDPFDPHRPEIDQPSWSCTEAGCDGTLHRVPQVMDAWFDSGSMPFAQWHYPFDNTESFETHFPAHFIAEGLDQTRGWFYSLLAISTLVFDAPSYRSVVVNDLLLDEQGQKMSKSKGNVVDPWETLSEYGADATRFYLLSSSNPWLPKKWDPDALRETNRKLFDTLRSTYRFFAMYAGLEGWSHEDPRASDTTERTSVDRWILSRLDELVASSREDLEAYDLTRAARRVATFVLDDLSNWYVRQSRDRFWATGSGHAHSERSTADAFATLHEALAVTSLVLAPFAPFHSDWLYRELMGASAHLADYPEPRGVRDEDLERRMDDVRRLSTLGRAAREEAGIRVRQPLGSLQAVIPGGRRPGPELEEILKQELNVREVVFPSGSDDIVRLFAKPDFARLGPRFGSRTPGVAKAIEALDAGSVRRLAAGETAEAALEGEAVEILPGDVKIIEEASGDLMIQAHEGFLVGLDTVVTPDLEAEGLAREIVNRVQRLRRDSGLDVSDRIVLGLAASAGRLRDAASGHAAYIAGETLAVEVKSDAAGTEALRHTVRTEIEGEGITLGLSRAGESRSGDSR